MHHKFFLWGILVWLFILAAPLPALAQNPSPSHPPVVLQAAQHDPAASGTLQLPNPKNAPHDFSTVWSLIIKHHRARASHFSPELVACLMWEESGFRLVENRASGALGFGQILPSTLRHVNKKYNTHFTRAQILSSADASVEATILTLELMWKWKRNKEEALVAYAGGMRNYNIVQRWLAAEPYLMQARWQQASRIVFTRDMAEQRMVDALKMCSQPGYDPSVLF